MRKQPSEMRNGGTGIWFAGAAIAALALCVWWNRAWFVNSNSESALPEPPITNHTGATAPPALPPIHASRFLNAAPEVKYVGREACAKCHPGEYQSYLQTSHSRALEPINLAAEPPDIQFAHAPSGREYEVVRRDGSLVHREILRAAAGMPDVIDEHPVHYAIGSGHHSRSYLVLIDGFLMESPITWYAAGQKWAMSPGYDKPRHQGFERIADLGCVQCHAGRVTPVEDNRFLVTIHESAIGCESCHGPGELHAARHAEAPRAESAAEDLTIVHPARLSREENESLCAQCHLRGSATPSVRGRRGSDFRPGLRLADFKIDFVPGESRDQMKVVGHMEQMRASACYRQSDSLTCTTCHDPHGSPSPADKIAYYRGRCLQCHQQQDCQLPETTRLEQDRQDNCVACHMPQRPTDLPHFAFTHHRIGLHQPAAAAKLVNDETAQAITLLPLAELDSYAAADQERILGLAYLEYADLHAPRRLRAEYHDRAWKLLRAAQEGGAADGQVFAGLARLNWEANRTAEAFDLASETLRQPDQATGAHADARFIKADCYQQQQDYASAAEVLAALAAQRRVAEPWLLLGVNRAKSGDLAGGIAAMETAAQISPFRADIHDLLATMCQQQGDRAAAEHHAALARQLAQQEGNRPP